MSAQPVASPDVDDIDGDDDQPPACAHHGVVGVDHVVEGYLAEQVTGMVRVWG
jgi:hypothetical protein